MLSFPMPFCAVPCSIWLPKTEDEDEWGNANVTYAAAADIETSCCYTPGSSHPGTADDIEDGRPHGATVDITLFLPKSLDADLREALIACYPPNDSSLAGKKFRVIGNPYSYPRDNTPGDYSWMVEAVTYLG